MYLSEDNKQDTPDTHATMMNIYKKIMDECIIKENYLTVWEETYVFENQYIFALYVHLMKSVSFTLNKRKYREIGAPTYKKNVQMV